MKCVLTAEKWSNYTAFGAPMNGRQFNSNSYKYGFNGKEKDAETGTQDYGLRIYNPSIGKFLSVDPLSPAYPWYTPYSFAGNKPIWCIDLDGGEEKPMNSQGEKNLGNTIKFAVLNAATNTYKFVMGRGAILITSGASVFVKTRQVIETNPQLVKEAGFFVAELFNPGMPIAEDAIGDDVANIARKGADKALAKLGQALSFNRDGFKNVLVQFMGKASKIVGGAKNLVISYTGGQKGAEKVYDVFIGILKKGGEIADDAIMTTKTNDDGSVLKMITDIKGNNHIFRTGSNVSNGVPTYEIQSYSKEAANIEMKFYDTAEEATKGKPNK